LLAGAIAGNLMLGGCRPAPAPEDGNAVKPHSTSDTKLSAAPKGGNSGTTRTAAKPAPVATMTVTQAMGVDILKAFNAEPRMKGHAVSVGTDPGTVWLNGSVVKAEQRVLAERIARRVAPKSKVVNQLKVGSPPLVRSSGAPVANPVAKKKD